MGLMQGFLGFVLIIFSVFQTDAYSRVDGGFVVLEYVMVGFLPSPLPFLWGVSTYLQRCSRLISGLR